MQLCRCPVCHARIDLVACIEDEAGRELLALIARLGKPLGWALVQYLTLFRAKTRDLANDRALTLASDALEITSDHYLLARAMQETVEAMRAKREVHFAKPLKNHNYLKQVVATIAERTNTAVPEGNASGKAAAPAVQPQDNNEAWKAQMRKLGHDPDSLLAAQKRQENQDG